MASGYEVRLAGFSFPGALDEKRQDFRLQVDLRYREGADGDFNTTTVILPGLGLFWECAEKQREELKRHPQPDRVYARADDEDAVAVERVGAWDTVFRIRASELYEMRVTVFDVDHKSWWSKAGDVLRDIRNFLVSLPVGVAKVEVGDFALKSVSEDAMASIGRRLAGDKNRALFVGSAAYEEETEGSWVVAGAGVKGRYAVEFDAKEVS